MNEPLLLFSNIKKARVSSGLSQKDLAKSLEISDKTVSAYETGRAFPPTPTLAKIANLTNTTLGSLMGFKEDNNDITKRLKTIEEKISFLAPNHDEKRKLTTDAFVGVVLRDEKDRIYLIKEEDKNQISKDRWNLPSGFVEKHEGLTEAAVREVKEKTGFNVLITSLLGCYKCKKRDSTWIYTVFEATLAGKNGVVVDPEVKLGKWFTRREFLQLDISKIVHPDMQLVYHLALKDGGLKTDSIKFIDFD